MEQLKAFLKLIFAPAIVLLVGVLSPDEVLTKMTTITGIALLVPIVVEPIKQALGTDGWSTRFVSLGISFLLTFASYWFGWAFDTLEVWHVAVISCGITVSAWGWITIEQFKLLLAILVGNIDKIAEIRNKLFKT